jgi:hypothetical protein
MQFYWLVLGILSVWRVTHLLYAEDGPWDVVVRLRRRVGTGFWARLLDCFYCLSLWIAAPLAYFIGNRWRERLLLWLAMSGGAILLERAAPDRTAAPPLYSENQEETHVLRQESTAVAGDGRPQPDESECEPAGSARRSADAGTARSTGSDAEHGSTSENGDDNSTRPANCA